MLGTIPSLIDTVDSSIVCCLNHMMQHVCFFIANPMDCMTCMSCRHKWVMSSLVAAPTLLNAQTYISSLEMPAQMQKLEVRRDGIVVRKLFDAPLSTWGWGNLGSYRMSNHKDKILYVVHWIQLFSWFVPFTTLRFTAELLCTVMTTLCALIPAWVLFWRTWCTCNASFLWWNFMPFH